MANQSIYEAFARMWEHVNRRIEEAIGSGGGTGGASSGDFKWVLHNSSNNGKEHYGLIWEGDNE